MCFWKQSGGLLVASGALFKMPAQPLLVHGHDDDDSNNSPAHMLKRCKATTITCYPRELSWSFAIRSGWSTRHTQTRTYSAMIIMTITRKSYIPEPGEAGVVPLVPLNDDEFQDVPLSNSYMAGNWFVFVGIRFLCSTLGSGWWLYWMLLWPRHGFIV